MSPLSPLPQQRPPRFSVPAARAAGQRTRHRTSPDCVRCAALSGVIEISPLRGERVVRNIRKCGAISRYKAALRFLLQQHSRFTFYFLPSTFYLLPFTFFYYPGLRLPVAVHKSHFCCTFAASFATIDHNTMKPELTHRLLDLLNEYHSLGIAEQIWPEK